MKIIKVNYGYSLIVMIEKVKYKENKEEELRIEIDEKFRINIPATGSVTSKGVKQLIEALESAISLNDKKIIIL